MDLVAAFEHLPKPSRHDSFSVDAPTATVRIGKSYEGFAAVLVQFRTRGGVALRRELANIEYRPPAAVQIVGGRGKATESEMAILVCRTTDARLARYFLRIVASVLWQDAASGDEIRFEASLDTVIALFRATSRPGSRTIQGLWAELAVVAWSTHPATAVTSWHSGSRALHDFSAGTMRLEVKSTSQELREHTFVLDQLTVHQDGETVVASVMVIENDGGASVQDLVDLIQERLDHDPETRRRLEVIVGDCLGDGWRDADDLRFDFELARDGLLLFSARDIPTIPQPLPPSIKAVHFTVDLSTTPRLALSVARALGAYFVEMLPTL